jgi:hypothetical protein
MDTKQRLIADRNRVINQQLRLIETLKRHPDRAHSARAIAECLKIIADCERLKALIFSGR